MSAKNTIRLALSSKGRMLEKTQEFLENCGLELERQSRNYLGRISGFPNEVSVVFQRQTDIVRGVENGLLTFGIAGYDLVREIPDKEENIVIIHEGLGFGKCSLEIAVPEDWEVENMSDLKNRQDHYRVATKFPKVTAQFLEKHEVNYTFVEGAGTLEVSPALGNSDIIVDLVSTGRTLAANRLKQLNDGRILSSQMVFIGNREALARDEVLQTARRFLEYMEGTLRADDYLSVHVNMRGSDPEEKIQQLFGSVGLEGLQGPTVSPVVSKRNGDWFAIHIIVKQVDLMEAIESLREIGGSGVVVTPCRYIFEEGIESYSKLLDKLDKK